MKAKLGLLLIAVLLLVGCANYEWVLVPPRVDVGQRVAVLFFDNYTDDYALSYEIEQELARVMGEYYRVLEPAESEWALNRVRLRRGELPSYEEARKLGELLEVDALVFGEVSGYFAPVSQSQPYIVATQITKGQLECKWEITQNTRVMVSFTGRVIDTHSGNMIFRQRAEAERTSERKQTLFPEWLPEHKSPDRFFLPRPDEKDIPGLRRSAVREAVSQFSASLLPTRTLRKIVEE